MTSVPAQACVRVAREFASNAERSHGRSMVNDDLGGVSELGHLKPLVHAVNERSRADGRH